MTKPQKTINIFLAVLSLFFVVLSILPYSTYKAIGDKLSPDGTMERMTPEFSVFIRAFVVFCFVFFAGLLIWGTVSPESRKRFFQSAFRLPKRCVCDIKPFFHDLNSSFISNRISLYLLVLILIAGTVIRVLHLNEPLLHDEAYSMYTWGRNELSFAISDYHLPNNHVSCLSYRSDQPDLSPHREISRSFTSSRIYQRMPFDRLRLAFRKAHF